MKVPVQITFRNLRPSDSIRLKIFENIDWIEQFSDQIISCHVVVEMPHKHHRRGNLFNVRIKLCLPGEELVISRGPEERQNFKKDVFVAIHSAFDEARRGIEDYTRKRRVNVKTLVSPPHAYVVRLICEDVNYGFIRTEDGRDLYFHSNSVLNGKYDQLKVGTEVRYAEEMGDLGPQASTVEIVGSEGRRFRAA